MRTTAAALRTHMEFGESIPNQRLWVFTSQENYALAEADGTVSMLEEAGALVLVDTCPEVTPYNREKYNHLLTNSMKAEHYLTSGLNRIPTSVASMRNAFVMPLTLSEQMGQRLRLLNLRTVVTLVQRRCRLAFEPSTVLV